MNGLRKRHIVLLTFLAAGPAMADPLLASGRPAGVRAAQSGTEATILIGMCLAAIAGGVVLVTDKGSGSAVTTSTV